MLPPLTLYRWCDARTANTGTLRARVGISTVGVFAAHNRLTRHHIGSAQTVSAERKTIEMQENDLIYKAEVIKAIKSLKYNGDFISTLIHLPTVDAVPIRHGRWIKLRESPEWDQKRCSVCGDISCCQRNYCPNCGAKMDK